MSAKRAKRLAGFPSTPKDATGAVVGLVGITPGTGFVSPLAEGLDRQVHGEEAYRGGSAAGGLGESVILLPSERVHGG